MRPFSSIQFVIEFDAAKSRRNEQERRLPFQRVTGFDFGSALFRVDDRKDYGEPRVVALGLMDGRVHAICFTFIEGGIRVISLRKANKREVYRHDQSTAAHRR